MIILEGPDGAGKSTLNQMLSKSGMVTLSLESPRRTLPKLAYPDACRQYLMEYGEDKRVSVDRFYFSEVVCGSVLRNKIAYESAAMVGMAKYIYQYCFTVFCLPGRNNLVFKPEESPYIIEKAGDLYDAYSVAYQITQTLTYNTALYNWKIPGAFDFLCSRLKCWQEAK